MALEIPSGKICAVASVHEGSKETEKGCFFFVFIRYLLMKAVREDPVKKKKKDFKFAIYLLSFLPVYAISFHSYYHSLFYLLLLFFCL